MDGFESKTLKRKFDRIVFGSLAGASAAERVGSRQRPRQFFCQPRHRTWRSPCEYRECSTGCRRKQGKKGEGAKGKKVAEIFSEKSLLKDTRVEVRGKVVKYNPGIMGKNWIHIRDGSGSREKKDDDITVTTLDSAAVGDTVLVKGTVRLIGISARVHLPGHHRGRKGV